MFILLKIRRSMADTKRLLAIFAVFVFGVNSDVQAQCTAALSPASSSVCVGTTLQASPTGSIYTYQGQDSSRPSTSFSNISGATGSSFTPTVGDRHYRVVITNTSTSCVANSARIFLASLPDASI